MKYLLFLLLLPYSVSSQNILDDRKTFYSKEERVKFKLKTVSEWKILSPKDSIQSYFASYDHDGNILKEIPTTYSPFPNKEGDYGQAYKHDDKTGLIIQATTYTGSVTVYTYHIYYAFYPK